MRDEKLHAVVARSTFPSQNVQSTPGSDHFWKLRCRKSACHCGAKHMSKSKCTEHTRFGPLLELEMSKKCTPLWREAHFEEHTRWGPFLAVEMSTTCTQLWRQAHFEVKMYKTLGVRTTFGGSDVDGTKHISKSKCTKHTRFGPLLELEMSKKCTPLWREAHFEEHTRWGPFLAVEMSTKCTQLWRQAHFEVKMYKTLGVRTTFGGSDVEKCTPLWREAHFEV